MNELWSMSIAFRVPGVSLRLFFASEEAARLAYGNVKLLKQSAWDEARGLAPMPVENEVEVADDYGTTATIDRSQVMLHWVTDMKAEAESTKEMQLLQARTQKSFNNALAGDPLMSEGGRIALPNMRGKLLNG